MMINMIAYWFSVLNKIVTAVSTCQYRSVVRVILPPLETEYQTETDGFNLFLVFFHFPFLATSIHFDLFVHTPKKIYYYNY